MDFENLAFGSLSRIVVSADTFCYCPACREICEPEELSGIASDRQIPTCPICGERTVARPSAVGDVDAEVGRGLCRCRIVVASSIWVLIIDHLCWLRLIAF